MRGDLHVAGMCGPQRQYTILSLGSIIVGMRIIAPASVWSLSRQQACDECLDFVAELVGVDFTKKDAGNRLVVA